MPKQSLFAGSDEGAKTVYLLFLCSANCKHLKFDPIAYLRDLLMKLPEIKGPRGATRFWLSDDWAELSRVIKRKKSA